MTSPLRHPSLRAELTSFADKWLTFLEAEERRSADLANTFEIHEDEVHEFFQACLKTLGLRVTLPQNLMFLAGQVFFAGAEVEEVRLVGKYQRKGYAPGQLHTVTWPPRRSPYRRRIGRPRVHLLPANPKSTAKRIGQGGLYLAAADAARSNISVRRAAGNCGGADRLLLSYRAQRHNGQGKAPAADTEAFSPDALSFVPTTHFYSVLQQALARQDHAGCWQTFDQGGRYFKFYAAEIKETHETDSMTANDIAVRVLYSPPVCTAAEVEARFAAMSPDLVADILDIFYSSWITQHRPHWANLSVRQLLAARGKEVQDFNVKSHLAAIEDARSLRLAVGSATAGYAVLSFPIAHGEPLQNAADVGGSPRNRLFRFGAGNHIRHVTKGAVHRHQSNFYNPQLAVAFNAGIWKLDPKKYAWAKRLARALRVDWRRNAEAYRSRSRFRAWRSILDEAGIDPIGKFRGEFRTFEGALNKHLCKLQEIGAIGASPFNDIALIRSSYGKDVFGRVNRLETFLDLEVCVPPPIAVSEHNSKYKVPSY